MKQSCGLMFIVYETIMLPNISCLMEDVFILISFLYEYISVLHNSYIIPISSLKIWTREIDNIPIKIEKTMYMLNTIPSPGIQIYMTVMKQNFVSKFHLLKHIKNARYCCCCNHYPNFFLCFRAPLSFLRF